MVVGVLTHRVLVHSTCDLKATQTNMQHSLIWKQNSTKNICCTKGELPVDENNISRWLKKFHSSNKNLYDQVEPPQKKNGFLDCVPSHRSNSIELSISQSSLVNYLHNLSKNIRNCQIVPHVTTILQNF